MKNIIETASTEDRFLAAACYSFVPALYLLLTERRSIKLIAHHSAHALFFWLAIFIVWVLLRIPIFYWGINLSFLKPVFHLLVLLALVYGAFLAISDKYLDLPGISSWLNALI